MTEWVRMKHSGTGGVTLVPKRSVASYERRGWEVSNEDVEPAPSEPAADVRPSPSRKSVKQDPVSETPGSDSNETKEDG